MKLADLDRPLQLEVTGPTATRGLWQQQHVRVDYSFPVVFTRAAFDIANPDFLAVLNLREPQRRHRIAVFLDSGVAQAMPGLVGQILAYVRFHMQSIELAGDIVVMSGGETCKNDANLVDTLISMLSDRAIDRHSYSVAIGGGALLDAVGYASAIFHRGIRHIRFPTTVLAQDDSGVGVKNAVNWRGQKNLVGTFAPPWAVVNDANFIDTLSAREKRAGLAEAVKVALIRDHAFFLMMEKQAKALAVFDTEVLHAVIARSANLHMHQIAHGGDPFESGSARPLDYGHWVAHKLERLTAHALSHGEAVAIGLALDARYSCLSGLLPDGEDARICRLLKQLGFDLWHEQLLARDARGELMLLQGLREFKEHLGGELTITLLAAIGSGIEVHEMDAARVLAAIQWLHQYWQQPHVAKDTVNVVAIEAGQTS